MTGAAVSTFNPFPGLRPFSENEQHLFFGREAQVDRMVDKLAATRFLAVLGSSGSGKSSLVNCGLRPALRRGLMAQAGTLWRMIQFRPGGDPIHALARALAAPGVLFRQEARDASLEEMLEANLRLSSRALVDTFRQARMPDDANLLIVVDQFEELFRFRKSGEEAADSAAFVRSLLEASEQQRHPIYVVLTMRSDFLGDCSHFEGLPEAMNEGQYLVPRMTRDQRRAAIAGPAEVGGGEISPVLLTRLVNDVGDNPDQLSMLQHAMNRTWARWTHEGGCQGPVLLKHYEDIGTMAHALDQHAEKAWSELSTDRERRICEKIFKALTDRGTDARGVRRPVRFEKLCRISGGEGSEVLQVMARFREESRSFLMPPEGETIEPETVVDISHESLMRAWNRLRTWTEEEAAAAREYRRLVDRASAYPDRGSLLRDLDLEAALKFERELQPVADWADLYGGALDQALEYLRASEADRQEKEVQQELNRLWETRFQPAIFAAFAVLFLATLIFYRHELMPPASQGGPLDAEDILDAGKSVMLMLVAGLPFLLLYLGTVRTGRRFFDRIASRQARIHVQVRREPLQSERRGDELPLAGWGKRALAFIIDLVIGLFLFVGALILVLATSPRFNGDLEVVLIYGVLFSLQSLYHALTTGSGLQGTIGMLAAGVKVARLSGQPVSRGAAVGRQLLKTALLPIAVYWPVVYAVSLWIAPRWSPVRRKQWPHDVLARTIVVPRKQTAA